MEVGGRWVLYFSKILAGKVKPGDNLQGNWLFAYTVIRRILLLLISQFIEQSNTWFIKLFASLKGSTPARPQILDKYYGLKSTMHITTNVYCGLICIAVSG